MRRASARVVARLAAVALLILAGCTEVCLLNGECAGGTVCLEGECRTPCVLDTECPVEQFCLGGGCRALRPGERPPCRDDAGCLEADAMAVDPLMDAIVEVDAAADGMVDGAPDRGPDAARVDLGPDGGPVDGALTDGAALDGAMLDGPMLDGPMLDGGLSDGALDGGGDLGPGDGGPGDAGDVGAANGGLGVDLTGLYAVTTTVVVATGGALAEGDELRHIHRMEWLGGTRYRLEVYATDGVFEHQAEIDLASPEGPGRYQFEYPLSIEAPEGCVGTELRFQRGRFEQFAPAYRLLAAEERTVGFEGEQCEAGGYLARVELVWTPLPPP